MKYLSFAEYVENQDAQKPVIRVGFPKPVIRITHPKPTMKDFIAQKRAEKELIDRGRAELDRRLRGES